MMLRSLALLGTLFASACTSETSAFETSARDVEGIYRLTSHRVNTEACSPGGLESGLSDRYAIAFMQDIGAGVESLQVMSCGSIAECRTLREDWLAGTGSTSGLTFGANDLDNGALIGRGASTGFSGGPVCSGGTVTRTSMRLAGNALTIEHRTTIADDYPSVNGACTTDAAQRAAAGNACSELELVSATFVEQL